MGMKGLLYSVDWTWIGLMDWTHGLNLRTGFTSMRQQEKQLKIDDNTTAQGHCINGTNNNNNVPIS